MSTSMVGAPGGKKTRDVSEQWKLMVVSTYKKQGTTGHNYTRMDWNIENSMFETTSRKLISLAFAKEDEKC